MPDPKQILSKLPEDQRAAAWDAIAQAQNREGLQAAIAALPLDEADKAALWDLRVGSPKPKAESDVGYRTYLGFMEAIDPIAQVKGAYDLATGKALNDMAIQGVVTGVKVGSNIREGKWKEAGHELLKGTPIVGPIYEKASRGDVAGALGYTAGVVGPAALGAVLPKRVPVKPIARSPNPELARAMDMAMSEGVPLGTAQASGRSALSRISYAADTGSIAGIVDWEAGVGQGFRDLAQKILREVEPSGPVTGEAAGTKLSRSMARVRDAHATEANAAFADARQIMAQHVEDRPVTRQQMTVDAKGKKVKAAVTEMVPMEAPVDLLNAQRTLAPILDKLLADPEWKVLAKNGHPGIEALKSVVYGDRYAPLDRVLAMESAIGKLQRGSGKTGIRHTGEALGAKAFSEVKTAIDEAVQALGPDAAAMETVLNRGRMATKKKWAVDEELGKLGQGVKTFREGRDAFNLLVADKDANINQLRRARLRAPQEMTLLGRAWLEDTLDQVFLHGDVDKVKGALSKWDKLGDKTKAILFPDGAVRTRVNDLMVALKAWKDSPNPSGTGGINATLQLMRQVGPIVSGGATATGYLGLPHQAAMSGISVALHHPDVARALIMRGVYAPLRRPATQLGLTSAGLTAIRPQASHETDKPMSSHATK